MVPPLNKAVLPYPPPPIVPEVGITIGEVGVTPICPKPVINEASTPFMYEGITLCFL